MSKAMATGQDLARIAQLLADPTRARICNALMDGRAWTATELAHATGVAASSMSEHLSQLVRGGLLEQVHQGRHRYVRLAGQETAQLIELLGNMAGRKPVPATGYRQVRAASALESARTCYDHLAGRLGLAIKEALVSLELLDERSGDLVLTPSGTRWVQREQLQLPSRSKRPVVKSCLDWTERRSHVGGQLGAAICSHLFQIQAIERTTPARAVRITDAGAVWFREALDLDQIRL